MKFTNSLLNIAAFAALTSMLAFASPAPASSIELSSRAEFEKRTPGGVKLCTDINWGGTCGYAVQPLNTCIVLGDDWNNKISSFGPDPCTLCFGYDFADCDEASWEFSYPGDATGGLGTSNPWNDEISAFQCEQTC